MSGQLPAPQAGWVAARPQTRGEACAAPVLLTRPVSFWGGVGPTGDVIDRHHPDVGTALAGRVLVMRGGRGSSSAASVLAELIRVGAAPVAVVLAEPDPIIALGAIVADELYGLAVPVVTVELDDLARLGGRARLAVSSEPGRGRARVAY